MNLTEAIDWAVDRLDAGGIEEARFEAELLLTGALGIKKSELVLYQSKLIEDKSFKCYQALIKRRLKHEPTAYILGFQPFLGLDIIVNRSVLIPRPETELLAETAIKMIGNYSLPPTPYSLTIADIGTGSGCIAVALAKHLPQAVIYGIDSSSDALQVAKKNAGAQKVAERCKFIKGNLLEPLKEPVDLIVANPPYIPTAEIGKLQPEVKDWEPRQALDGGKDGLDHIRKLIAQSPNHLTTQPPGSLIMEFGFGQAAEIEKLARANFQKIEVLNDYAGTPRLLSGQVAGSR
ncbi:MAG TPA: peptide chain release factor N(5)-glutamine methyltransferase [Candidatus Sulfotelmatobacter sp.]|nr:peptide chain release factor N(5)-glutamine methyltransferase [Candidatus Sulfotelmatobacter sp.]